MKRQEALDRLEDFMNDMSDNGTIHIVEINGFKHVGFRLNIEEIILNFIEKDLGMLPALNEGNYHYMDNNDRIHENQTVNFYHAWEEE